MGEGDRRVAYEAVGFASSSLEHPREMLLDDRRDNGVRRAEESLGGLVLDCFLGEVRPVEAADLAGAKRRDACAGPPFNFCWNERLNLCATPHIQMVTPPPGPS